MLFRRTTSVPSKQDGIASLARLACGGDGKAFQQLVELHTDVIHGIAWSYLGQQEAAEDLVQEVFLRAWVKLPELREPERFSGWLTRMARNEAISWCRKRQSRSALVQTVPLDEVTEKERGAMESETGYPAEKVARLRAVEEALSKLSTKEQELLHLHFNEELSQREIAERLSVHHTTVSRQMTKALSLLRSLLGVQPPRTSPAALPSLKLKRRLAVLVAIAVSSPQLTSAIRAEMITSTVTSSHSPFLFENFVKGVILMTTTQKVLVVSAVALLGFGGWYAHDGGSTSPVTASAVAPTNRGTINNEVSSNFFGEQVFEIPTNETLRINFTAENPEGISELILTATPERTLVLKAVTKNGDLDAIIDPRNPNPDLHLSHVQIWPERNLCYILAAIPEQTDSGFRFHFFASNKPELLPQAKAIEAEFQAGRIPKKEVSTRLEKLLSNNGMLPVNPTTKSAVINILQNEM